MKLIIKSAKIIDPQSDFNRSTKDILIENGIITKIGSRISTSSGNVLNTEGQYVSPGWFDMNTNLCDPGYEFKEDLMTGCRAAAHGGFTGVACMPNTNPPLHSKSQIEYVKKQTINNAVEVYPIGTISKNKAGKELSEMIDMHKAGAIAFSDGDQPVADAGLMLRALLYVKRIDGLIISTPNDPNISANGMVNEGITSTILGLKGIPSLAEEISINRDIYINEYADSRLHISNVSTTKAVDLIRQAKRKNIKVTAETSINNLIMDDTCLKDYDSNYKVLPPLRAKEDIRALIKGLTDGTIDVISSNHSPQEEEAKKREFDHASFGIIGLETLFPLINTYLGNVFKPSQLVQKLAIRPRQILNLPVPSVNIGSKANLTIFETRSNWTFKAKNIKSKSKNTPFIGTKFKGKVIAVINNNRLVIND